MKIVGLETYVLKKEITSSMVISRGGFKTRYHTLVKVITDSGLTGLGEGIGNALVIKKILEGPLAEMAVGLDPCNIEAVRTSLLDSQVYFERMGSVICAVSAIEMACWDIKAKSLNVPLHHILGGLVKPEIETYVSDVYWTDSLQEMRRSVRRILDLGFHSVKAHLGYKGPRSDLERVKALRSEIGSGVNLMIDLNAGYQYSDALLATKLWEDQDLFWLEEPLNPNHIERMGQLNLKSRIPIAAGENEFRIFGFKNLFEAKAIDIAMPDIGRAGGIQETKNICVLAEAYGVEVSPHCFSSGVLLAATIHLIASTPNSNYLEFDSSENAVIQELLVEPLKFKNGKLLVSQTPGMGVHLSKETIARYGV